MKKLVCFLISLMVAVPALAGDVLVFDENDIKKALASELVEQGHDEEVQFEFFGGKTDFSLPDASLAKIMISNLNLDEEQNKFSADAEIFADGELAAQTHLSGRYFVMISAYVPHSTIEKGQLIAEDLLTEIKVRANRVKPNNVIEKDKLVGWEAKKTLRKGKLIVDREIGAVVLVRKGEVITAVYKSKGLQITSKAEALEDGGKGQRIELVNIKSGKKFLAKVTDANTVEIENE